MATRKVAKKRAAAEKKKSVLKAFSRDALATMLTKAGFTRDRNVPEIWVLRGAVASERGHWGRLEPMMAEIEDNTFRFWAAHPALNRLPDTDEYTPGVAIRGGTVTLRGTSIAAAKKALSTAMLQGLKGYEDIVGQDEEYPAALLPVEWRCKRCGARNTSTLEYDAEDNQWFVGDFADDPQCGDCDEFYTPLQVTKMKI